MKRALGGRVLFGSLLAALAIVFASGAQALEAVDFEVPGGPPGLVEALRANSLLAEAERTGTESPPEIVAAALADYPRLVETLYAAGRYGGTVSIRIDGREAADMPLLALPARVDRVTVRVDPGPEFRFGLAQVAPLAPGTVLPEGFATGKVARAPVISDAARAAVDGWRAIGHAKAAPSGQDIVADHRARRLDAAIAIDPGPRLRFGRLIVPEDSAVRPDAIARIAGFPTGEVFSPAAREKVEQRLRRAGAFASVAAREAETPGPDGTLDIALRLADAKPRRFGLGAEITSLEGLALSAFWMHRNAFGGAERLRFDASVSGLGSETGGVDAALDARLDIPAVWGADTGGFVFANLERLDEPGYLATQAEIGAGVSRIFSDTLSGEIALGFSRSRTVDDLGTRDFTLVSLPTELTWDRRDNPLDPARGTFLRLDARPFAGLAGAASGLRSHADARAYASLGTGGRAVLAGRLQLGSVAGPALTETRPDLLFFSGGTGTVRGQPFQSLGVDLGGGSSTGGRAFLGASAELRFKVSDRFGAVAFADAGYVGAESFPDGSGTWHAGAGVGLRYQTGIGPIRLDVAAPLGASTGGGSAVQVYVGIGQAF